MRIALAIVVAAVTSASAAPPSPTLERAIKLYDKQDWYSAHIELTKVLTGETADDAPNKQRAEFFVGKALYQMGYYVAAQRFFDMIANTGANHAYYRAALKWYAALADKVGYPIQALRTYDAADLDDPSVASARDQLRYLRGMLALERGDLPAATAELVKVGKGAVSRNAELALAFIQTRLDKVLPTDEIGDRAALLDGQRLANTKQWDKAIAAYGRVRATGPYVRQATWGASWARLAKQGGAGLEPYHAAAAPVSREVTAVEPSIVGAMLALDYCATKAVASDGLAGYRSNAKAIEAELAKLVAIDDNADFFDAMQPRRRQGLSRHVQAVVGVALASPRIAQAYAFVDELQRELALLAKSDKAYQTTQAAAEILQELTVQQSVAQADAGKLARDRVVALAREVPKLLATPAKLPVGGAALVPACP
jgi:tetratricopeptide (TPR) repeat protein